MTQLRRRVVGVIAVFVVVSLSFSAQADSGDHLHPGDGGYKAMADSIDLKVLTAQP